jgi:hypothetical protein
MRSALPTGRIPLGHAAWLLLLGALAGACSWAAESAPGLDSEFARVELLAETRPEKAEPALRHLDSLPEVSSDPRLRLRRDLLHATLTASRGSAEEALRQLDSLESALATQGDSRLRVKALSLRANILNDLNRFEEMRGVVNSERLEAEASGNDELLATVEIDAAWTAAQTGNYEEGEAAILAAQRRSKTRRQTAQTALATAILANLVDDAKTSLANAEIAAGLYR